MTGAGVLTAGTLRNAGSTGGSDRLGLGCCENTELNGDWKNVKGVTLGDRVGTKLWVVGAVGGGVAVVKGPRGCS